jgi:hypothetical protein
MSKELSAKNSLLTSLLLIVSIGACSQTNVDFRPFYYLKGSVKIVKTVSVLRSDSIPDVINYFHADKELLEFNEKGHLRKRETYSQDKDDNTLTLLDKETHEFENGRLKYQKLYDGDSTLIVNYQIIKHNIAGFPLEIKLVQGKGSEKVIFLYHSNKLEKISYAGDMVTHRLTDSWDQDLNLLKEELVVINESSKADTVFIRSFTYLLFDKRGNWTKRISKEEKTGITINEERELVYF